MSKNLYLTYPKITMSCGGWSKGEISDEIRGICKHEKFVESLNAAMVECDGLFEPTSVEQQVVSGMNYKITGTCCGQTHTFLVWHQAWNGGVQQVQHQA